jgi:hypothetical protein
MGYLSCAHHQIPFGIAIGDVLASRQMNHTKKVSKIRTLELKKETVVHLGHDLLKQVVGGNNSTRPSQCRTLCF